MKQPKISPGRRTFTPLPKGITNPQTIPHFALAGARGTSPGPASVAGSFAHICPTFEIPWNSEK